MLSKALFRIPNGLKPPVPRAEGSLVSHYASHKKLLLSNIPLSLLSKVWPVFCICFASLIVFIEVTQCSVSFRRRRHWPKGLCSFPFSLCTKEPHACLASLFILNKQLEPRQPDETDICLFNSCQVSAVPWLARRRGATNAKFSWKGHEHSLCYFHSLSRISPVMHQGLLQPEIGHILEGCKEQLEQLWAAIKRACPCSA